MNDQHSPELNAAAVKGRMARFMEPCILLLLDQAEGHGYELMERLNRFGFDAGSGDMATLYRTLRSLEDAGMVESEWEEGGQGPQKRVYRVTDNGRALLNEWIAVVRINRDRLTTLLEAYRDATHNPDQKEK